ncbi:MAG: hypothetical protein IPF82_00900 [Blastocatellia bacterium]|nr:hypothetical protein [Blastocatellia bacterium]
MLYSPAVAHLIDIPDSTFVTLRRSGVQVTGVEPDSVAEAMGLEAGDRYCASTSIACATSSTGGFTPGARPN